MVTLKSALTNGLMASLSTLVGIVLVFVLLEGFLLVWARTHPVAPAKAAAVPPPQVETDVVVPPELVALAARRRDLLTMPEAWKRAPTTVAGAVRAEYWQGVLQVYNEDSMRWSSPLPPRRIDHYRVMVVGDSLTYGEGLAVEWRFSDLLEHRLGEHYRIEFINLGRNGFQSEDILKVVKKYLPSLQPNLVLYAVCLNDFLPSRSGQYKNPNAYALPVPKGLSDYVVQHSRAGAFLTDVYDGALRRLRLRNDFYADILADFGGYQQRFARDVTEMNRTIQAAGLPPMLAMVVDQYPRYGGPGHRIARIAEEALSKAGAMVIPTEDYYRRYTNQAMNVSRWEGHPDEVANYIWAHMVMRDLQVRPDLRAFQR